MNDTFEDLRTQAKAQAEAKYKEANKLSILKAKRDKAKLLKKGDIEDKLDFIIEILTAE